MKYDFFAGQERFTSMTRVYFKESNAACIVFDVSNRDSFNAVIRWKQEVDKKVFLPSGQPVPVLLLANKVLNNTTIIETLSFVLFTLLFSRSAERFDCSCIRWRNRNLGARK